MSFLSESLIHGFMVKLGHESGSVKTEHVEVIYSTVCQAVVQNTAWPTSNSLPVLVLFLTVLGLAHGQFWLGDHRNLKINLQIGGQLEQTQNKLIG